jgi:hypothetical protein
VVQVLTLGLAISPINAGCQVLLLFDIIFLYYLG